MTNFHAPCPPPRRRRRISLRDWIELERRLREQSVPAVPEPVPEPPQAAATLGALACRYRPGDRVGIGDMVDVAGLTRAGASLVRRWAKSVNSWPYLDSTGFGIGDQRRRAGTLKGGVP